DATANHIASIPGAAAPGCAPGLTTERRSKTMSKETNSISTLQDPGTPVRAKLAAAWTSLMFLYIYVDYFHLYKPGAIDEIRGGHVFEFDISPTLLTIFLTSVAIPALMVMLSLTLPSRVNRATNLVVALLLIPYS